MENKENSIVLKKLVTWDIDLGSDTPEEMDARMSDRMKKLFLEGMENDKVLNEFKLDQAPYKKPESGFFTDLARYNSASRLNLDLGVKSDIESSIYLGPEIDVEKLDHRPVDLSRATAQDEDLFAADKACQYLLPEVKHMIQNDEVLNVEMDYGVPEVVFSMNSTYVKFMRAFKYDKRGLEYMALKLRIASGVFPATTFGNLSLDYLSEISIDNYVISPKIDGVKCILIGTSGKLYLVDRKSNSYYIGPLPVDMDFILDAELIIKAFDSYELVLIDVLYSKGDLQMQVPFNARYDLLCYLSIVLGRKYHVRAQRYYSILCSAIYSLAEGLVFTPLNEGYTMGHSVRMFKWKPDGDTVDFKIVKHGEQKYYATAVYNRDRTFNSYKIYGVADSKCAEGSIVECNQCGASWRPIRLREDKLAPNVDHVAQNVMKANANKLMYDHLWRYLRRFRIVVAGRYLISMRPIRMWPSITVFIYGDDIILRYERINPEPSSWHRWVFSNCD